MINAILTGIFNVIIGLVGVLLTPIDLAVKAALPGLSDGINAIGGMFDVVNNVVGFCISATGLSDTAIDLIIAYYVFILTVPLTFSSIKLALKWYNSLKF